MIFSPDGPHFPERVDSLFFLTRSLLFGRWIKIPSFSWLQPPTLLPQLFNRNSLLVYSLALAGDQTCFPTDRFHKVSEVPRRLILSLGVFSFLSREVTPPPFP